MKITIPANIDKKVAYTYKLIVAYASKFDELIRVTANRRPQTRKEKDTKQDRERGHGGRDGRLAGIGAVRRVKRLAEAGLRPAAGGAVAPIGWRLLAETIRQKHGHAVATFAADLADDGDLRKVEERIAGDDKITLQVNNAGVSAGSNGG